MEQMLCMLNPKNGQNHEISLEPNHTQFIFIDDGIIHQYGSEIQFRARFEKAIYGESFTLETNQQDLSDTNQNKDKSTSSYSQTKLLG
jgi:hypothetical protein